MVESRPTQVFISYAHADSARLADFRRHFGPVERGRNLTVWFDRNLTAGQAWNDEIRRQINASDIFVCLVSAAFLSSNYIMDTELPAILQAERGRGALLIPVILETCFWKNEFGAVQCLPKTDKGDLKPVNKWRPQADGYHAAADQAANAIDAWLKTLPPPPIDPGPGVSLLVTQDGFDLAPDVPGPAERDDPLQKRLLQGLREIWQELMAEAGVSCANSHPMLLRNLERYGPLIEAPLAEIDVVALTTAGSALGGMVAAVTAPPPGVMAEPLEPEICASFETLLRQHTRLVMGFAEAREMIARDGMAKQLIDDAAAARRTLHDVLEPMIEADGLLTKRTRDLVQRIDDGLMVAGAVSTEALASAVRQGGRSVASIARAVARKIGSPADVATLAGFLALLAGDPNMETYRAAFSFLHGNAAQLLAFAAHQPELRRLIDWTLEQFGKRERPVRGVVTDVGPNGNGNPDEPPPDFDMGKVHVMIVRGEVPPQSWVPWIRELRFEGREDLTDLTPISGLTALRLLDCSETSVSDLAPLFGLTALEWLDCSETSVSDLAPLSGLTALKWLDCSETSVSELAPLSGLSALEWLDCSETSASDLSPLSGLTALRLLDCSETLVSDLDPLSGLTKLHILDCSETSVSDLSPLAGLTALEALYCSETLISSLGAISGLTELHTLYCWRNSVSDLSPLSGLKALRKFSCWSTLVSDLSPLSDLGALQMVDCGQSKVSDLSPLSGLTELQTVSCWQTSVSDLDPLSGLTMLHTIDCSWTSVSDVSPLSGLTALHTVDCSWTSVSNLAPLSNLPGLKRLYLAGIGGITNAEWLAEKQFEELVLLGCGVEIPVELWATYQIGPDGTVHDPDGAASPSFYAYVKAANPRAETTSRPD